MAGAWKMLRTKKRACLQRSAKEGVYVTWSPINMCSKQMQAGRLMRTTAAWLALYSLNTLNAAEEDVVQRLEDCAYESLGICGLPSVEGCISLRRCIDYSLSLP